MRYSGKVERQLDRIPDVRYPEKVERRPGRNSGCDMSGWNVGGRRILDVRYLDGSGMSAGQNSGCETSE